LQNRRSDSAESTPPRDTTVNATDTDTLSGGP